MNFNELGLCTSVLRAIEDEGYENPTPVQAQAIPHLLKGMDLLACAQTGTGKTAAFTLPIIHHLTERKNSDKGIKVLIVTPTRELAIQIDESIEAYGRYAGIKHAVIFGGVNQFSQVNQLRSGVDILVATPGRLLDLYNQGFIRLHQLTHFVLDEADRMLDMGFVHDVKKIIRLLPEKRQSLFFSATMPDNILALASSILSNPVSVKVDPVSSTAETVDQGVYFVNKDDKNQLLLHILNEKKNTSVLVFTRTKHGADKVVKFLSRHRIESAAIHGNKSQNARQKALSSFKSGEISVLVATDIAARGIDIDELAFVINYEIPNIPETYVHRIGRTGRAGNSGKAFSFCDAEERAFVRDIEKLISKKIPVVPVPFNIEKSTDSSVPGRAEEPNFQPVRQDAAGKTYFRGHAGSGSQGSTQGTKNPAGKKKWFKKRVNQNQ